MATKMYVFFLLFAVVAVSAGKTIESPTGTADAGTDDAAEGPDKKLAVTLVGTTPSAPEGDSGEGGHGGAHGHHEGGKAGDHHHHKQGEAQGEQVDQDSSAAQTEGAQEGAHHGGKKCGGHGHGHRGGASDAPAPETTTTEAS